MELRQLVTFRAVATALSFTQAATALGYVQSTVTAQIQALEAELGVPLFDRLGRRVTLTDPGRRLLDYAVRILTAAEEARVVVPGRDAEAPEGSLAISALETLSTYRLPTLLTAFRARYPGVQVAFRFSRITELRRNVSQGAVDVAFAVEPPIADPTLCVQALSTEQLLVLAAPDHPLASAPVVRPIDLMGQTLLLNEPGCPYRGLFLHALGAAGVQPELSLGFNGVETLKHCTMMGMGITVLPTMAVAVELAQGRLASLEWHAPESLCLVAQVMWHKDRWVSPALRAFLDTTREVWGSMSSAARPLPPPGPRGGPG